MRGTSWLLVAVLVAGEEVGQREECGQVEQWEEEHPGPQLRSWVAQQRSKTKLTMCREERESAPLGEGALPLYTLDK